jgi:hypothetical protein
MPRPVVGLSTWLATPASAMVMTNHMPNISLRRIDTGRGWGEGGRQPSCRVVGQVGGRAARLPQRCWARTHAPARGKQVGARG